MTSRQTTFEVVPWTELGPHVEGLRELEASIEYPIADGEEAFTIDHGPDYHPFFTRMGHAAFIIVRTGERVTGSLAGVWKPVDIDGYTANAFYLADYKLAPSLRGGRTALELFWWGFKESFVNPEISSFEYVYGAAMRGERGDVTSSFGPGHPGSLLEHALPLHLYFAAPSDLAQLPDDAPAPPKARWLDLSPGETRDIVSTAGCKDLRLTESSGVWPLHHLPRRPARPGGSYRDYLVDCGRRLASRGDAVACFALDPRLADWNAWLEGCGVTAGATCTVYGFEATLCGRLNTGRADYVHLATSQI